MRETLKIQAGFEPPLRFADFDRKPLKRGMRKIGAEVRTEARKLVSQKAISKPGEFPGKETGILRGSIINSVSRSGFSAIIKHNTKTGKAASVFAQKGFYPAMVVYGHAAPKGANRVGGKRNHSEKNPNPKVAQPRANYIAEAAQRYGRSKWQREISKVLEGCIKSSPIKEALK